MGSRFRQWIRETAAAVKSQHVPELTTIGAALNATSDLQRYHVDLGSPDRAQRDGGATRFGSYYYFTRDPARASLLRSGQWAVERLQDAIAAAIAASLGPDCRVRWPGEQDEDIVATLLRYSRIGQRVAIVRVPKHGFLRV